MSDLYPPELIELVDELCDWLNYEGLPLNTPLRDAIKQLNHVRFQMLAAEKKLTVISEETHVRVFIEAGNGSHYVYRLKGEPLGLLEYEVSWISPGDPGWQSRT